MPDANTPPNIVDVIVKDFIDDVPAPLGIDQFSQGQMAERRRIRKLLTGMRFPDGRASGSVLALGLGDVGQALIGVTKQTLSEEEFSACVRYADRMMSRFASRRINASKVLAVCGMIITVAGEIQKSFIAESAQETRQ